MPRRFGPPDDWVLQAFSFAIEPTDEQVAIIARFFGARRKAYNWALEQIKAGIDAYHATGVESERPSLYGLRKRWNAEKSAIRVNTETGEVFWKAADQRRWPTTHAVAAAPAAVHAARTTNEITTCATRPEVRPARMTTAIL